MLMFANKLYIACGRDKTKQEEMPYFHCGLSSFAKRLLKGTLT